MTDTTETVDRTDPATHLGLLGRFSLRRGARALPLPRGARRVVAYVALRGPVNRSVIAAELWADRPEHRAAANLRSALWRLCGTAPELLESDGEEVALAPRVRVDAHETVDCAQRLLRRERLTNVHPGRFARELLPGWYEDWVLVERERIRQLRLHALEALAEQLLADGEYGRAVDAALAAVQAEPLRESAHRALIEVHLAEDNRSEALRQYHRYRALARAELAVEPSAALADLVGLHRPQRTTSRHRAPVRPQSQGTRQ